MPSTAGYAGLVEDFGRVAAHAELDAHMSPTMLGQRVGFVGTNVGALGWGGSLLGSFVILSSESGQLEWTSG